MESRQQMRASWQLVEPSQNAAEGIPMDAVEHDRG